MCGLVAKLSPSGRNLVAQEGFLNSFDLDEEVWQELQEKQRIDDLKEYYIYLFGGERQNMNKQLRKKYPLRKIVREFVEYHKDVAGIKHPRRYEELSCGHVIPQKSDIYGFTNAMSRRCYKCAAEHHMHLTGGTSRENSDSQPDPDTVKEGGSPTRK